MTRALRSFGSIVVAIAALSTLAACSSTRETLGLVRRPPDEFTIVRKPPLVMPPSFSLRPPRTGSDIAEETDAAKRARAQLVGQSTLQGQTRGQRPTTAGSSGEQALLARARATDINPSIRDTINRETTIIEEKERSFVDRLVFWRRDAVVGDVVDARKEADRLRQASAAGEAPTGADTPVIQRRRRALLEGIF